MGDEALSERFGGLVRRLRVEKGYSQEEFSFRVGLHQTYVSSIERGERNVTIQTADRIARALGTTLSSMLSELDQYPDDLEDA
ncbi:MAG TPA: helix-turn-helix transcriptional regulator [Rubrobacter sp.]|nr:helix-turn-helix transcriptional regulator [Rubrobacter sp.]